MADLAVSIKDWQRIGPPVEPAPGGWRYHLVTYFARQGTGEKLAVVYDVDVLDSDTLAQQRDKMSAAAKAAGLAQTPPFNVTLFGYEPLTFVAVP